MYKDFYSKEIIKKLIKLKKKDSNHYLRIRKKMDAILENQSHSYKFLTYNMKGANRVHLGHFVLVFIINHQDKTISFEDYDHHDIIYLKN